LFLATAEGQREMSRLEAHSGLMYCLAWSPDGRLIASGGDDNAFRIWQAEGLNKVEEFSLPDIGWSTGGVPYVLRMAWARNGAFLATNGMDDVVRLWDVRHLMPRPARSRVVVPSNWVPSLPENDGHGLGLIKASGRSGVLPTLALSPDGNRMFAGYGDNTLGCWDLRSGTELWTYAQPVGEFVAVSPDGQRLAASWGGHDVSIRETTAGRQLQVCRGHTNVAYISRWSPDSRRVASSSYDRTVRIWDADSGECLHVCSGHEAMIQALAWSPNGAVIVSGDDNGAIRIWDAETGHPQATWQPQREAIWGLSWSPDSQGLVAAYYDGRTLLVDAREGSVLRVLSETIGDHCGACEPAWSPDGRYLACAFRKPCRQIRIWDARIWQELPPPFEFPEGDSLSLAWSPNGAFLASSHNDNIFRFWDVRHLQVRTTAGADPRRASGPLPAPVRGLLGAFVQLHGLGIDAPLSLIRDLLALIGGRPVESPLRQLAPLLKPVAERRWPEAARLGVAAVVLHGVPLPGWQSPPDASAEDLDEALTEALHGEAAEPDAAAAPLALLAKSCERLDPRLLDLIELIGPMALAADPGLALRLLPKIGAMPPLADRQRALLGVRSRVHGRPGHATGVAAGADRLIAGGVEMGSFSAQHRHLLPTQLALPELMLRVRHARGELLFRPREAAEPPRQRPLIILLDVSPPVFGPVEATTRLAAHTAARAVLEAGLTAMLVTPADTGPLMAPIERPSDLAEVWTRRSFSAADERRLLALAQALRAALPHEPGIAPLVLLLTHTWFGADEDLPAMPHLRGLFVQHPGHPNQPAFAARCERHLCLPPGELANLAQQLAEVLA
jgi:ATP-dependent Clp protease ATP-binding subunit ClpC